MIPQAALNLIKSFETCRLVAFKPTGNDVWTIGWGHTHGVNEGDTCTQDQADAWLTEDIAWAENAVDTHTVIPLTANERGALVSLTYNIGQTNFDSSTLLRDLNENDIQDAEEQFDVWCKQCGTTLPGLVRRRAAEKALFMTPDDGSQT